jgi:hypothetical protein
MARTSHEPYWSAIIAQFHRSGLTHVAFCQRRRIPLHTFRKWLYRLRTTTPPRPSPLRIARSAPTPVPSSTPTFLPVHVRDLPVPAAEDRLSPHVSNPLELVLSHDRRVRVPVGFDPTTLRQLLDVLEERP